MKKKRCLIFVICFALCFIINYGTNGGDKDCIFAKEKEENTIQEVSKITLEKNAYVYTGKLIKPKVNIYLKNGKKLNSKSYTLQYRNNCKIGKARVIVKLKGSYTGSKILYFNIVPKQVNVTYVNSTSKGFLMQWKKYNYKITGFQIQYAANRKFKSAKKIWINNNKTSLYNCEKLKKNKIYYLRVRSYKMVSGKRYYSPWSDTKKIKTKKAKIAIDAGHQRRQNSAVEPIGPGAKIYKAKMAGGTKGVATGLYEYELNLILAKKLKETLIKDNYEVFMTRESHDVNISNKERALAVNASKSDILIRIHANGSEAQYVQGASTICCTKNNPYYAKASYGKSRKLSKRILNGIIEKTGCKNCGIEETDTMTGINWCEIPSTIVEVGYMSNLKEDRLLATKTYQNKLVKGMAEGIENYFGF